jgi:hypothetical protein
MNKITRRVALGSLIAGMAACPFIVRALRRTRQLELGPDSLLNGLRTRFEPVLAFPRKFDLEYVDPFTYGSLTGTWDDKKINRRQVSTFRSLPQDVQDTILETRRRYWQNFAQIDEAEFDCSHFNYNKDGTKKTFHGNLEGHVRMKYGYGLEIVGKDAKGEHLHWIFNLNGDISRVAREVSLGGMIMAFFDAADAMPARAMYFDHVVAVDADLPDNLYLKNEKGDKYTILSPNGYLKDPTIPPHIQGKTFSHYYYNQRTGIQEYLHARTYQGRVFTQARDADGQWVGPYFLDPKYQNPTVPLPRISETIHYKKTAEVAEGIFLPVECAHLSPQWSSSFTWRATYSNIRVKRV